MAINRLACAFFGSLALSSCMFFPVGTVPKLGTSGKSTLAQVQLQPHLNAGNLSTQAVINPYVPADVNHLEIRVFTLSGGNETPLNDAYGNPVLREIPSASLSDPIIFDDLSLNTTYRFRAYAYADATTTELISTTDSRSYVDVAVTNDDRPPLAALPVRLIDTVFSADATASGIVVSSGSLVGAGPEGMSLH